MRYNNNDIIRPIDSSPYYKNKIYPNVPYLDTDVYIIGSVNTRLDILALKFYKDKNLWWLISMTNPHIDQGSLYVQPGVQIRISIDSQYLLDLYYKANNIT